MEQRNLLLAIILSFGFILIWTKYVVPHFAPPPTATAPVSTKGEVTPSNTAPQPTAITGQSSGGSVKPVAIHVADNDLLLDPRGGGVQSWTMNVKNQTVDLVETPDAQPLPLTSFSDVSFKIVPQPTGAVMTATLANGLRVTKTLTLNETGHLHRLTYQFVNPTAHPIELTKWEWGWGPGLGTVSAEVKENAAQIRALTMGPINAHAVKEGDHPEFGSWVGLDNRYFLIAFIPTSAHSTSLFVTGKKEATRIRLVEDTRVPAHGETTLSYELYAGPKGYTQLKKYGRHLEAAVNFGTFSTIGKWILSGVYHLKGWTGNYGVAIILLTLGLQLVLMPLTLKSFKAAHAMKRLQPKIARLQEMYKGDPKRLNVEMLNLYKTSGTNPFGGCLPMLVQAPIFIALYTTIRNAYELRGAPFIGWIHDLSLHDPLYILPVIMGGAMFLQQRMTANTADPTQRQMMYIMPIMFTVMFARFPAGLVLYWLTNSLAALAIQAIYLRVTHVEPGTPDKPEIVRP